MSIRVSLVLIILFNSNICFGKDICTSGYCLGMTLEEVKKSIKSQNHSLTESNGIISESDKSVRYKINDKKNTLLSFCRNSKKLYYFSHTYLNKHAGFIKHISSLQESFDLVEYHSSVLSYIDNDGNENNELHLNYLNKTTKQNMSVIRYNDTNYLISFSVYKPYEACDI